MAETITIAGRKLPKMGVYVAGAGVVGFVGYVAWWSKGTADTGSSTVPIEETPDPVEEPTDTPGFTANTGGQPPISNAEWGELAVERLINIGLSGPAVSSAIGKFLARKPLNKVEADLVQQAVRAAGYPPQNGPWTVIDEPLAPPVSAQAAPGPVTGLRYSSRTRTQLTVSWAPPETPPGISVSKYYGEFYGGAKGGGTFVVSTFETASTTAKSSNNLRPNSHYGIRVRAIGANGKVGPMTSIPAQKTLG